MLPKKFFEKFFSKLEKIKIELYYHFIPYLLSRETFYPNGVMVKEGDTHFRPRLADTLERLAESGSSDIFYRGELGETYYLLQLTVATLK